ncbi:response regulator transcription factor [Mobilicoccus pelagius]|uniref:response regulator transcription factor n=1 Tax=Mobilicoccus pelagius TaxID=746032 RepID=UPI00058EDF3D|nr:response regulator transcription factor [Mobilicoccus pelagius]
MTGLSSETATASSDPTRGGRRSVRVLLFSDDRTTRDSVRLAVGRRPAPDVEIDSWVECATAPAVLEAVHDGRADVLILDGEAAPLGGLGLCRQLKHEVFDCPPVVVLTGRPQDAWLASWSYADAAVAQPFDALTMSQAVVDVARALPDPTDH